MKKRDLWRRVLKISVEGEDLIVSGKLFLSLRPTTKKALSPFDKCSVNPQHRPPSVWMFASTEANLTFVCRLFLEEKNHRKNLKSDSSCHFSFIQRFLRFDIWLFDIQSLMFVAVQLWCVWRRFCSQSLFWASELLLSWKPSSADSVLAAGHSAAHSAETQHRLLSDKSLQTEILRLCWRHNNTEVKLIQAQRHLVVLDPQSEHNEEQQEEATENSRNILFIPVFELTLIKLYHFTHFSLTNHLFIRFVHTSLFVLYVTHST